MRILYLILILLNIFWLTSCATVSAPAPAEPTNKTETWDSRAQTLSEVQSWNLKAQIALRTPKDAVTASMQWQQQHQNYHILLNGPLGSGSYELTGRPGKVELAQSSGKRFFDSSPEALLAKQSGWALPVSNLYYWIRGLPAPSSAGQKNLDGYNHLTELKQDGWIVRYLRYTSVNGIDLPSKIFIDNPQLNVKIIVNQWGLI